MNLPSPGYLLAHVPARKRTEKICTEFLQISPCNICFIPTDIRGRLITEEYAKDLVKKDFHIIKYIPKSVQKKLISWGWENRKTIKYFNIYIFLELCPGSFFNSQTCREIIDLCPEHKIFGYIPEKYLTPKLWEYACRQNPAIVKYLAEKLPSSVICRLLKIDRTVFSYLPRELKNKKTFRLSLSPLYTKT